LGIILYNGLIELLQLAILACVQAGAQVQDCNKLHSRFYIMLKNKFVIIGLVGLLALSSCGIFHKDCGCPHFGAIKTAKFDNLKVC